MATSPYGTFDIMFKTLTDHFAKGPYLVGEKFSAADVLWGTALTWTTMFGLVPETLVTRAYINRINARPAVAKPDRCRAVAQHRSGAIVKRAIQIVKTREDSDGANALDVVPGGSFWQIVCTKENLIEGYVTNFVVLRVGDLNHGKY
jgi:Glutathione S-transferase, C-terminal domain